MAYLLVMGGLALSVCFTLGWGPEGSASQGAVGSS
jgi:hypothetical protein